MNKLVLTRTNTSTPYGKVKNVRNGKRPTSIDYIENIFRGFFELHGDRRFGDDPAVVGGVAYLGEEPVTVIGIEKGHDSREHVKRAFGSPQPEGYRKALRLMQQAEKFHRPVICFIDTCGAFCGVGAEERGQGQAIAENLMTMMTLKVPTVSILIGEGESGGALALGVADAVWMLANAVYSVISPEGCASILWKNAAKAEEAAESLKLTAEDALKMQIIDQIIPEEQLGQPAFYELLENKLTEAIAAFQADPDLLQKRYAKFRKIGTHAKTAEI